MALKSENNDSSKGSDKKQSLYGLVSVLFGLVNIFISVAILWALHSYINDEYVESLFLQIQILNIGSKIELFTKPLGLILGIIGIFDKNKKKTAVIYGILINSLVLFWTFAVFAGLVV